MSKAARLKDSSSKKVIRFIKIEDTQQGEFEAEINTFIQIKHDNVLSVNMVKSPYQNFLVMDFSEFGSLYKILHVNKDLLSDLLLLNWAQQLLLVCSMCCCFQFMVQLINQIIHNLGYSGFT